MAAKCRDPVLGTTLCPTMAFRTNQHLRQISGIMAQTPQEFHGRRPYILGHGRQRQPLRPSCPERTPRRARRRAAPVRTAAPPSQGDAWPPGRDGWPVRSRWQPEGHQEQTALSARQALWSREAQSPYLRRSSAGGRPSKHAGRQPRTIATFSGPRHWGPFIFKRKIEHLSIRLLREDHTNNGIPLQLHCFEPCQRMERAHNSQLAFRWRPLK